MIAEALGASRRRVRRRRRPSPRQARRPRSRPRRARRRARRDRSSVSCGVKRSIGEASPATASARDRVRLHRDQLRRAVQSRLLEQAAAPAHAGHLVAVRRDAVRSERKIRDRRDVRQHLVARVGVPLATTAEGRRRAASSTSARASASGANDEKASLSATCRDWMPDSAGSDPAQKACTSRPVPRANVSACCGEVVAGSST